MDRPRGIVVTNAELNDNSSKPKLSWNHKVNPSPEVLEWRQANQQKKEWYSTSEAIRIAENVLFFQHQNGGWGKNFNFAARYSPEELIKLRDEGKNEGTTIDNGATHSQLVYLAKVYHGTGIEKYKDSFLNGIEYLLKSQYENGGWPQYYPLRKGYYTHITFNDGAMIMVMQFLRDVVKGQEPYTFVDEANRKRINNAVDRGLDIVLKTQILVDGELTGWCGQHDSKTLKPAKARAYELPSICGRETTRILQYLMEIENPNKKTITAIESAAVWLTKVKITGIRLEKVDAPSLYKGYDLKVVEDTSAPPLWARFYEIGTNRPMFVGRDGIVRYQLSEIEQERRVGYSYYVTNPSPILNNQYPQWKQKWVDKINK